MKKIAICITGAVSKKSGSFNKQNELYCNSEYVNYNKCYESIINFIINSNPNYSFDFYIHCWNIDLEKNLNNLYKPIKSLYENNSLYNNEIRSIIKEDKFFSAASKALSIKKCISLIDNLSFYDKIIIYRPDLILFKQIILDDYYLDKIYVNKFFDCNGDFHFIMNSRLAEKFKYLYDSAKTNYPENHVWIKNYIINYINEDIIEDNIVAGIDQEVIRKLKDNIYE